ncbi:helix-turn-helix transcriptional regulator [Haladaptatus sp. NG-SE-30]
MTSALEDIRYLSDSEHRVVALEALGENPRTQSDLRAVCGSSSATVSRLLRSFGDRGWVVRDSNHYVLTPLGQLVATVFEEMYEGMETAAQLRDVVEYLPVEEIDFDLRHLAGARVTRPTRTDTIAPIRREVELMTACTNRFQMLVTAVDRLATQEVTALVRTVPVFEGIYTHEAFDTVKSDPTMRADLDSYMQAGGVLYLYDDTTSMVTLGLNDDIIGFELNDGRGLIPAFIETDDKTVLDWAERTYEQYKDESRQLDADAFSS